MRITCDSTVRRSRLRRAALALTLIAPLGAGIALSARSPSRAADVANNVAALNAATEARLGASVKYLASDALEGRGPGTHGLDAAADYLWAEFNALGLKTTSYDGTPFQKFRISLKTALGPKEKNRMKLVGPGKEPGKTEETELVLAKSFTTMSAGGSAKFDLPLAFVGYGITANEEGYDDYAGIDVKDKAVVILRHNPQLDLPGGLFTGGHGPSRHATFDTKISNAYQHGAAMVILVNDDAEIKKQTVNHQRRYAESVAKLNALADAYKNNAAPSAADRDKFRDEVAKATDEVRKYAERWRNESDPLLGFDRAGPDNGGRTIPVVFVTRSAIDPVVQRATGKSLAEIERAIDALPAAASASNPMSVALPEPAAGKPAAKEKPTLPKPAPKSALLGAWRTVGETAVDRQDAEVKNVIAVLEGQGPNAEETIVIGAHYDHLGRGGVGSLAPGSTEIHNGADDNASGTSALLEVARMITSSGKRPGRRIVFMAFSGEERGLLGSEHYVKNPLFPLDKTVAMLNMDMVGRLKDEKLILQGADTATEFLPYIEEANKAAGFKIAHQPGGFGPSDHASFYPKHIPVMHFFTGLHPDYHRPSDDADKVDLAGMRRVSQMVYDVAMKIAEAPARPTFKEGAQPAPQKGSGGDRPYFGSIPDFGEPKNGFSISGVSKGGPAEKAGLKAGDVITRLGDNKIGNLDDFDAALRKFKAGDKVKVAVRRGDQSLTLEATLEPPK
jgi:hypothetical protein